MGDSTSLKLKNDDIPGPRDQVKTLRAEEIRILFFLFFLVFFIFLFFFLFPLLFPLFLRFFLFFFSCVFLFLFAWTWAICYLEYPQFRRQVYTQKTKATREFGDFALFARGSKLLHILKSILFLFLSIYLDGRHKVDVFWVSNSFR